MKQRVGKKGYKAREKSNQAFLGGTPREELTGLLRKWVDRKYFKHSLKNRCFVYEGFLYIFDVNGEQKTVFPVPYRVLNNGKLKKRAKQRKNMWEASFL